VKDIANVYSDKFPLTFSNYEHYEQINCSIKKTVGTNLLVICKTTEEGEFSLVETENPIVLDDINIKYNFIIQPIKNTEVINFSGYGVV